MITKLKDFQLPLLVCVTFVRNGLSLEPNGKMIGESDLYLKVSFKNQKKCKKSKLLLSKSPWPAWGLIDPLLAKVRSAPEVGQPLPYYLNSRLKIFREAGQGPKSTPHSKLCMGWPRSRALPTLASMGSNLSSPGQGDLLNSSLMFSMKSPVCKP